MRNPLQGYIPMIVRAFTSSATSSSDSVGSPSNTTTPSTSAATTANVQQQIHQRTTSLRSKTVPIIICLIIACSAFPFSLLHYFIPQMLQKQFLISDEDVGTYAGLVDFSDSIASFLSSAFIGYISDLYGKKWLLVISLLCSMLRLVFYAFTRNVWMLIAVEFLYGVVNCSSVLLRALLVEFSSSDNRARFFGYFTASYAISRAFSSLFGGMLVSFQNNMKVENPYLIYSLVSAVLTFVSLVFSLCIPSKPHQSDKSSTVEKPGLRLRLFINWFKEIKRSTNKQTLLLILCRGMLSFASGTLVWTLFAFTPVHDFGLELSALRVGAVFMLFGLISFGVQFFMFTWFTDRYGLRGTFMIGGLLAIVQLLLFPFSPMAYWNAGFERDPGASFWVTGFLVFEIILYAFSEIVRPALDTMIVNTSDLGKQGTVQGLSRMSHVFSDAIGSIIVGWLYSYFTRLGNVVYVFVFSATFYLIPVFIVYLISDNVEMHYTEDNKIKSKTHPIFDPEAFQLTTAPKQEVGI